MPVRFRTWSLRSTTPCSTLLPIALLVSGLLACSAESDVDPESTQEAADHNAPAADVIAVETTAVGDPSENRFRLAVTVRSDDVGCERYADWWEVVTLDGVLLQRRILAHSHVDEQPFTRSGEAFELPPDLEVLVRAHLHPTGYAGSALRGSIENGWRPVPSNSVATELEESGPLPAGCRF